MTSPRQTELREIPLPDVPEDGGVLRVAATGVCGSDWARYLSETFAPAILGHEIVGRVEKIGRAARARWGVAEGDYVAVEEYLPCGHCAYCRTGEPRCCAETDVLSPGALRYGATRLEIAPSLYGGFSQYLYLHPRSIVHRLPETLPPPVAAMAQLFGNGFQWVWADGGVRPGQAVLVLGPGPQGLACVAAAAAAGAETVVIAGLAHHKEQLEIGLRWGATHALIVDDMDARAFIADATRGAMMDLAIETSSAGAEIVNGALPLLKKRGRLLCTSFKKTTVPFDLDRIIRDHIRVQGTRGRGFDAMERAIAFLNAGHIPLALLPNIVMGLGDADHALAQAGAAPERAMRFTIDPWS